jgi:excisionase family DNA binding protein
LRLLVDAAAQVRDRIDQRELGARSKYDERTDGSTRCFRSDINTTTFAAMTVHDIPPDLAAGIRAWVADIVRTELKIQLAGIVPSPKAPPSPYMTTAEAGEYARVSSATIRRWIRDGRLQAHGAGREIRVRLDDIVEALRPNARNRKRGRVERKLSPEEQADVDFEHMLGEHEMERRTDMTGTEALRLAGPLDAAGFGNRQGTRTRQRNKELKLVDAGKLSRAEFAKREAERERINGLDRARVRR